jgi:beta-lactamase regulating signal transducer with metallopeptidase domain
MNSLANLIESPVIERLGWTLLHSTWEGLCVAIVLASLLPFVRRRGARAAYGVCCSGLLLTALLPAMTFSLIANSPRPSLPPARADNAAITTATSVAYLQPVATPTFVILPITAPTTRDDEHALMPPPSYVGTSRPDTRPLFAKPSQAAGAPNAPPALASVSASSSTDELTWRERAGVLERRCREQVSSWLPLMVFIWCAGVVALSLWNVGGWFAVHRLKLSGTSPAPAAIQQAATHIAKQLGLTRGIQLLQSTLVESPVVIGALKPVILLPASLLTQIPADQLESLLAHELAHVLRHDYLVNLLQTAIETLLFYHPAVWWISAQIRTERENCCDDLAIGIASDRAVYVRALASVAGVRASSMAPAATGGQLVARLRRILGVTDSAAANPSRWLTGVAIISVGGAAIAFFALSSRPVKAQPPAPQEQKKEEPNCSGPQKREAQDPAAETKRIEVGRAETGELDCQNAPPRVTTSAVPHQGANADSGSR